MRYLVVFGRKGWEVIDTKDSFKVVAEGTLAEMNVKRDELNKKPKR